MTSRTFVIAVYLCLFAALVCLAVLGRQHRWSVPSFSDLITWTTNTRSRRIAVVVTWAWLGLHFFAR